MRTRWRSSRSSWVETTRSTVAITPRVAASAPHALSPYGAARTTLPCASAAAPCMSTTSGRSALTRTTRLAVSGRLDLDELAALARPPRPMSLPRMDLTGNHANTERTRDQPRNQRPQRPVLDGAPGRFGWPEPAPGWAGRPGSSRRRRRRSARWTSPSSIRECWTFTRPGVTIVNCGSVPAKARASSSRAALGRASE